jgi:hypothetical protein
MLKAQKAQKAQQAQKVRLLQGCLQELLLHCSLLLKSSCGVRWSRVTGRLKPPKQQGLQSALFSSPHTVLLSALLSSVKRGRAALCVLASAK